MTASSFFSRALVASACFALAACGVVEKIGGSFATTLGAGGDAFCDRREVTPQKMESRSAFCQDIVDTVAGPQFRDDCSQKFGARTGEGACDHAGALGGCAVDVTERDGSQVTDWFYPVDFDPNAPKSAADVGVLCADKARYDRGAHFVAP